MRLVALVAGDAVATESAPDTFRLLAAENALGAAVGLCWAHPTLALDEPRPARLASEDGLLAYGDAVLDEVDTLPGAPFSDPATMQAISNALWTRIIAAVAPSEDLVAEQLGNGLAPEALPTS